MLRKEEKDQIIEANRTHEHDTGSPEVQIAILTKRINDLTGHQKTHKKELPEEEGCRTVSCLHRKAWYS